MKRILIVIFFVVLLFIPVSANAVYDPLSKPNNNLGIHILFPDEVIDAAKLVNSSGGDWGYVTIPIQSSDKDIEKWQKFMDDCKKYHLIPIIRLATNGDYFNTKVWEKPKLESVLDFANFLNSLEWPTKNKYVIVFNEVNRGDEWGGSPEPKEYAEILSYAVTVFKSKNQDFFIISPGLDNASINNYPDTMDKFTFFKGMEIAVPGIFNQVDGISSHSYPNPGFSQLPTVSTSQSISSFAYEKNFIKNFTNKDLPIFITETGWTQKAYTKPQIGSFYQTAFKNVWTDKNIIAITPFILKAGTEPFLQFSMKNIDGSDNEICTSIKNIQKIKGEPILEEAKKVLGKQISSNQDLPIKSFKKQIYPKPIFNSKENVVTFLKWILRIE